MTVLPDELRWQRPASDEWSAAEVIRHVLASDAICSPRVLQVLIRPGTPLPAFDERAWAERAGRAGIDLNDLVAAFRVRRLELVGVLRSLSDQEWELTGEHEQRGTLSIPRICADLLEHEQVHRHQLETIVAGSKAPSA